MSEIEKMRVERAIGWLKVGGTVGFVVICPPDGEPRIDSFPTQIALPESDELRGAVLLALETHLKTLGGK